MKNLAAALEKENARKYTFIQSDSVHVIEASGKNASLSKLIICRKQIINKTEKC